LSAYVGYNEAQRAKGRFLLRIEDIDPQRCRSDYEVAIYDDLAWLGIGWEQPVRRQSDYLGLYAGILEMLGRRGLTYPCFCSRRQIAEAQRNAPLGLDGPQYPGTCRHLPAADAQHRIEGGEPVAWRLDVMKAAAETGPLSWTDRDKGTIAVRPERIGDVILGRRDVPASYHLSVVIDDALQGITLVTRGMDLFDATDLHRMLQALLGYPTPAYLHHRLIIDPQTGSKLSKRDGSLSLAAMRRMGMTPPDVLALLQDA
jgi:glutamyl-Q tRNA(Asp) synthetase